MNHKRKRKYSYSARKHKYDSITYARKIGYTNKLNKILNKEMSQTLKYGD